jgi:hypothetical protein
VEIRLTAEPGGTRVTLEHRDLPEEQAQDHRKGWTHYLTRLHTAAITGDAGPDPGM